MPSCRIFLVVCARRNVFRLVSCLGLCPRGWYHGRGRKGSAELHPFGFEELVFPTLGSWRSVPIFSLCGWVSHVNSRFVPAVRPLFTFIGSKLFLLCGRTLEWFALSGVRWSFRRWILGCVAIYTCFLFSACLRRLLLLLLRCDCVVMIE